MEKFDKNFLYSKRSENHHSFFVCMCSWFWCALIRCSKLFSMQNVFEALVPTFLSYWFIFFISFSSLQCFCWFRVRKLFEIHKSFMHIHHVLKLMNHLRGFPMMNGWCCIGNNNDVSLFISAFFPFWRSCAFFLLLLCTVRSFGFSLVLFWVFITFVHVRSAHNSHFIYAFGFHIIYWSIFGACCIEIERKRRKKVAHIWVWAFKSIIINVFVFAHIHFISNIFFFPLPTFSPEAISPFDAYKMEIGCNPLWAITGNYLELPLNFCPWSFLCIANQRNLRWI